MNTADNSITMQRRGRILVLLAAFLGWMFAGWEMSLLPLSARAATIGMLREDPDHAEWVASARQASEGGTSSTAQQQADSERLNKTVGTWFARYIAAFLLGAALGGWVFGWLADHSGRVRAMALSIVWYSAFTGISYFVQTPLQMCVLRFVACMGIGGMWPAGVALVAEAWPDVSRPTLAGLIGTAANVGIAIFGMVVSQIGSLSPSHQLTPDSWRWVLLLGTIPVVLGIWVAFSVPESPLWLAGRSTSKKASPLKDVLQPPLLKYTLAGIALGAIPLLGSWGSQKWILPWAGQVGATLNQESLKADTQTVWAIGAAIGSLCGGWMAMWLGRRTSYFVVSLGSLLLAQWVFTQTDPSQGWKFMLPVFVLGIVGTVYFGWLPLFLPELFPTPVRATGTGVAYNSGRIVSAVLVLATSGLVVADYAEIGAMTCWVYAAGMVVIFLVPKVPESIDERASTEE
ncbi:MAG: MFS transporter [Planctomycetaceae bacterium]